jgi:hypothetical protein
MSLEYEKLRQEKEELIDLVKRVCLANGINPDDVLLNKYKEVE